MSEAARKAARVVDDILTGLTTATDWLIEKFGALGLAIIFVQVVLVVLFVRNLSH